MPPKRKGKVKKLALSRLGIQKTEDKDFVASWKSKGARFKMGLTAFVRSLFELNESLPSHQKMTNAEIERQILEEYGHVNRTATSFATGGMTVNKYRYKHNAGVLIVPFYCSLPFSFRYDIKGQVVDTRTGRHPLEPIGISETIEKYYVLLIRHQKTLSGELGEMTEEEFREHLYQVHEKHFNVKLPRIS